MHDLDDLRLYTGHDVFERIMKMAMDLKQQPECMEEVEPKPYDPKDSIIPRKMKETRSIY